MRLDSLNILLKDLPQKRFNELERSFKKIEKAKDSVLFYEGEICKDIFILCEGKIEICISPNDSAIFLYDFCASELCIVNISSALSHSPALASAYAKTNIKGFLIPKDIFQILLIESKAFQKAFFATFSLRYNALITLIEDIKYKRLDARILEFLHAFNTKEIAITNAQIATHLSTSKNVINRILQDLKRKGLIRTKRGVIILED